MGFWEGWRPCQRPHGQMARVSAAQRQPVCQQQQLQRAGTRELAQADGGGVTQTPEVTCVQRTTVASVPCSLSSSCLTTAARPCHHHRGSRPFAGQKESGLNPVSAEL